MKLRISGFVLALLVWGPIVTAAGFSVHSIYAREAGNVVQPRAAMAKAGCEMAKASYGYMGSMYYFSSCCSKENIEKYKKSPEKYLKKPQQSGTSGGKGMALLQLALVQGKYRDV